MASAHNCAQKHVFYKALFKQRRPNEGFRGPAAVGRGPWEGLLGSRTKVRRWVLTESSARRFFWLSAPTRCAAVSTNFFEARWPDSRGYALLPPAPKSNEIEGLSARSLVGKFPGGWGTRKHSKLSGLGVTGTRDPRNLFGFVARHIEQQWFGCMLGTKMQPNRGFGSFWAGKPCILHIKSPQETYF